MFYAYVCGMGPVGPQSPWVCRGVGVDVVGGGRWEICRGGQATESRESGQRRARGRRGGGDGKDYSGSTCRVRLRRCWGASRTRSRRRCFGVWQSRGGRRWWGATGRAQDLGGCAERCCGGMHTRTLGCEGGGDGSHLAPGRPYRAGTRSGTLTRARRAVSRGGCSSTSRYEVDDRTFAIGFATNSPYNLQGFHSPNLLVVITERSRGQRRRHGRSSPAESCAGC